MLNSAEQSCHPPVVYLPQCYMYSGIPRSPCPSGINLRSPTKVGNSMRTEQARPVRLQDYRPPDWLVETVHLDIAFHPTATRVRSSLLLKPNADGAAPAPLVLDGDGLNLLSVSIDGEAVPGECYVAAPDSLTI